jgi:membrane glycosyltransferase
MPPMLRFTRGLAKVVVVVRRRRVARKKGNIVGFTEGLLMVLVSCMDADPVVPMCSSFRRRFF